MVAGVAAGLSDHLGIDVLVLRIGFVVTIVLGGLGVILYGAFWALVQQLDEEPTQPASLSSRAQLVAFGALGVVMLLIAQILGFGPGLLWPAAAAVTGAAIVWRQADEHSRRRWRAVAGRRTRGLRTTPGATASRYAAGVLLVIVGMATFLAAHGELSHARRALLPVIVVVAGIAVVVGPWLFQSWQQLNEERTVRIREQERVELAGRVHDSMLQTLTLIQRRADDSAEVRRLVRRSQRELRGWLYADTPSQQTVRAEVTAVCAEIEDEYRVTIDLVVVGDHPATAAAQPIMQAIREAAINAAKHSSETEFSVYVEIGAAEIAAFVRDRGTGFDVDTVPDDRFGVRDSVLARMERHGGAATIRSTAESGTEVHMTLPLSSTAVTS
jgi:signal transduction histidine kinase